MLLDIRQDRYFRVPATIAEPTFDWLDGSGPAPPAALISVLVRNGAAFESECDALVATATDVEIPDALEDPMGRAPVLPPVPGLTRAVVRNWIALRTRPLHTIIERHRALRRCHADAEQIVSGDMLSAYHRKRRLIPIKKNCLLDSLALDSWLGLRGGPRRIVFGVTSEPFLAHCWVQSDTAILNDSHDHVRRYSPILVV